MNIFSKRTAPFVLAVLLLFPFASVARAASTTVDMYQATLEGNREKLGQVTVEETPYGLVFTPELTGLPPGGHGFHIHAKGDCAPGPDATTGEMIPAGAAGGHYDPHNAKRHGQPWDNSAHLGDLPLLYSDGSGAAKTPVLAPRLKSLDEIRDHALMIHVGSDNYSDQPKPLGGGGGRMACGLIR